MNTGYPAVNSAGATGVLGPFPKNWPRERVPTLEERARMEEASRIMESRSLEGETA